MTHKTDNASVFFSMLDGMVYQEKEDKDYKPSYDHHDSLEAPLRAFNEIVEKLKEISKSKKLDFDDDVRFNFSSDRIDFYFHLNSKLSFTLETVRKARVDYMVKVSLEDEGWRNFSGKDTDVETFCYLLEKISDDFLPAKS